MKRRRCLCSTPLAESVVESKRFSGARSASGQFPTLMMLGLSQSLALFVASVRIPSPPLDCFKFKPLVRPNQLLHLTCPFCYVLALVSILRKNLQGREFGKGVMNRLQDLLAEKDTSCKEVQAFARQVKRLPLPCSLAANVCPPMKETSCNTNRQSHPMTRGFRPHSQLRRDGGAGVSTAGISPFSTVITVETLYSWRSQRMRWFLEGFGVVDTLQVIWNF